MSRLHPYMQRRGGALFFRIAVPADLRAVLGATEITKALNSSSASVAAPRALHLAASVKRAYWDIRQEMAMDPDKLADLMRTAREKLRLDELKEQHEAELQAQRALHRKQLELARVRAENDVLRSVLRVGAAASTAGPVLALAPAPPAAAPAAATPIPAAVPSPASVAPAKRAGAAGKAPSFGAVVKSFLDAFDKRKAAPMFKKHSTVLPLLLDIVGDKPLADLRQADINRFFDLVGRLPPRWADICRKQGISPAELAARHGGLALGPKTFEDTYKASVRAFLKVAKRDWQDEGFPVSLTTDGVAYKGARKPRENTQRAFRDAELKRIFAGPELASFRADASREHQFWLPYVGLFTGARVNEICQLNPQSDVAIEDTTQIWFFRFTEETETDERVTKSIKNAVSIRRVPIHKRLIELGFLEYVAKQRDAGHKLLFPAWQPTRGRASPAAEKWFRKFLADISLRDETRGARLVGMHAFRHTMLHKAYNADPPLDVTPITGHADEAGAVIAGYRGELSLANKKKVLEAIDFGV